MIPTVPNERPQFPSILTVYRPIEEYWSSSGLARALSPDPERVLDPMDVLLIHLVLDLTPRPPVLVDLAAGSTAGASSLIGLSHPRTRRVVTVSAGGAEDDRICTALREFNRERVPRPLPLDFIPPADLTSILPELSQAILLADVRGGGMARLADDLGLWLDERPDALVLLLGLGPVGDCPAIESLIRLCATDSDRQLRLIREQGEVLAASRLGMVTRRGHPEAGEILRRIQGLYASNYRFLDLLKSVSLAEVRAADIDLDVLKTHPLSSRMVAELRDQESLLATARRKLAPGVLGKIWRLSKRIAGGSRP